VSTYTYTHGRGVAHAGVWKMATFNARRQDQPLSYCNHRQCTRISHPTMPIYAYLWSHIRSLRQCFSFMYIYTPIPLCVMQQVYPYP